MRFLFNVWVSGTLWQCRSQYKFPGTKFDMVLSKGYEGVRPFQYDTKIDAEQKFQGSSLSWSDLLLIFADYLYQDLSRSVETTWGVDNLTVWIVKDGSIKILPNIGNYLPLDTTSHARRIDSSDSDSLIVIYFTHFMKMHAQKHGDDITKFL